MLNSINVAIRERLESIGGEKGFRFHRKKVDQFPEISDASGTDDSTGEDST
jgi:hypothetical protein